MQLIVRPMILNASNATTLTAQNATVNMSSMLNRRAATLVRPSTNHSASPVTAKPAKNAIGPINIIEHQENVKLEVFLNFPFLNS